MPKIATVRDKRIQKKFLRLIEEGDFPPESIATLDQYFWAGRFMHLREYLLGRNPKSIKSILAALDKMPPARRRNAIEKLRDFADRKRRKEKSTLKSKYRDILNLPADGSFYRNLQAILKHVTDLKLFELARKRMQGRFGKKSYNVAMLDRLVSRIRNNGEGDKTALWKIFWDMMKEL